MKYLAPVDALLPIMDRKNIRIMVNLTGGVGKGLDESIRKYQRPYPERFITFTEPWWDRTNQPAYSKFQADEIARAQQAGARGLKILKTLGLYLREGLSKGPLVKIDDPRFDAMWEGSGLVGMPVAIHVLDQAAFFLPSDRFNELVDELYEIYYRFLETEDEYFDYAPAPTPPQGRWRIYGLGLPDGILKKVYYENAARILQVKI